MKRISLLAGSHFAGSRQQSYWLALFVLVLAALACNLPGGDDELITAVPTAVVPTLTATPTPLPTLPPTSTLAPPPTAAPTETPVVVTATDQPAEPEPTASTQPLTPTAAATELPDSLAPGGQVSATLAAGGYAAFRYQGTAFSPVVLFVEGANTLDMSLAAYAGVIAGEDDLATTTLATADFATEGGVEVMVFSPSADGEYSIVVQSQGETAGDYTLYMFDARTPGPNIQLISDTLTAGQSKGYSTESNGARPVLVFVDPVDQSNLAIRIADVESGFAVEANYGAGGSAEALYVFPLRSTIYTVTIFETGGAAATFNLAIITLP